MAFYVSLRIRSQRALTKNSTTAEATVCHDWRQGRSKGCLVRRKWFIFMKELLKIAFVSVWSSMKWLMLKFVKNLCWADVKN